MNGSPSVKVALFIRNGGSESPCRWFYVTEIYIFFRINTFDPQDVTAQKCYDLIIEQPKREHQNIYKILDAIIKYRHGMR